MLDAITLFSRSSNFSFVIEPSPRNLRTQTLSSAELPPRVRRSTVSAKRAMLRPLSTVVRNGRIDLE